ncbi:MAG TPA: hypothetical protein DCE55_27860 [Planctomycetaceae bacterium]|nr:hypothetical protein [Planctomycetaceae bacterium]
MKGGDVMDHDRASREQRSYSRQSRNTGRRLLEKAERRPAEMSGYAVINKRRCSPRGGTVAVGWSIDRGGLPLPCVRVADIRKIERTWEEME